jgi:hypothetical protein
VANVSPAVSIVVASFSGRDALGRCLDSLAGQTSRAEVIVSTNLPSSAVFEIRAAHPRTVFLEAPAEASVFELRSRGIDRASAPLVLLTEDHTTVGPGWVAALQRALEQGAVAAGGAVDNGNTHRTYDWALYFCEYGSYMPPVVSGPVGALSGINVGYRREALLACREVWRDAFYENEVHDALHAAQKQLHLVQGAEVKSHLEFGLREAIVHLRSGGRHFGAYRTFGRPFARRLSWMLASPAVPVVLFVRLVRRIAERRPDRLRLVFQSVVYVALLLGAWSWGEALGTLFGSVGTSSESGAGRA